MKERKNAIGDRGAAGRVRRMRVLALLLALLCLTAVCPAASAESFTEEKKGSLRITVLLETVEKDQNDQWKSVPVPGLKVRLNRTADLDVKDNGEAAYRSVPAFAGAGVAYDGAMDAEQSLKAAERLAAAAGGIQPDAEGATDQNGVLSFGGLAPGMYLAVRQGTAETADGRIVISPALWQVPMPERESSGEYRWTYQVEVFPKAGTLHVQPAVQAIAKPTPPGGPVSGRPVKTGDPGHPVLWAVTALLALLVIGAALGRRKRT